MEKELGHRRLNDGSVEFSVNFVNSWIPGHLILVENISSSMSNGAWVWGVLRVYLFSHSWISFTLMIKLRDWMAIEEMPSWPRGEVSYLLRLGFLPRWGSEFQGYNCRCSEGWGIWTGKYRCSEEMACAVNLIRTIMLTKATSAWEYQGSEYNCWEDGLESMIQREGLRRE